MKDKNNIKKRNWGAISFKENNRNCLHEKEKEAI